MSTLFASRIRAVAARGIDTPAETIRKVLSLCEAEEARIISMTEEDARSILRFLDHRILFPSEARDRMDRDLHELEELRRLDAWTEHKDRSR